MQRVGVLSAWRRRFILVLGLLVLALAVGFSLSCFGVLRASRSDVTRYVSADVSDLPPGGVRRAGEVWVVHEPDGSFAAFLDRDPRSGVTLWIPAEQLFHSPAYGEVYDRTGQVPGRALRRRPLPRRHATRSSPHIRPEARR